MSDVPATFWWTLPVFLLMRPSSPAAAGAGFAAGVASLIRPNIWLLVAATVPLLLWR